MADSLTATEEYYKETSTKSQIPNRGISPSKIMPSGRSNSNSPTRVARRSRSRSPIRTRRSRSRSPPRRTGGGGRGKGNRDVRGKECRVYVSNLNYDVKWMELKDVMKKLGTVEHVEIFSDNTGRSKGCGVVEYSYSDDAARSIKELDGFEVMGRKIRLREDVMDNEQYAEQLKVQKDKSRNSINMRNQSNTGSSGMGGGSYGGSFGGMSSLGGGGGLGGLLGGPAQLISLLNNKNGDPINSSVFVSNLDYELSWQKLKDMFRRAGNCIRCDIAQGDDNRSKGFGTVQFETPFEALSAIALFNGMEIGLNRRQMSVRLDRKAALHQVLEQLGVPSNEVTQKTLTQIQSIATLAALSSAGGLGGALSSLSALSSAANPYQNLQSNQSSAAASLGLSGLSGIGSALGSLSTLLASGLGSSLSSLGSGSSSGMLGGGGGSYGMSSSSNYGSGSGMSSYGLSNQQSNRRSSDMGGGGRYSNNYSGGGGGGGGGGGSSTAAPGCRVFVRNLPFSVKWQDLKDKFREAGRINRADIKTNEDGRSKGCGTVTFETAEDANRAVSLFNESRMEGRELEVRIDQMNN